MTAGLPQATCARRPRRRIPGAATPGAGRYGPSASSATASTGCGGCCSEDGSGAGSGCCPNLGRNPNQIWRLLAMPLRKNPLHTLVSLGSLRHRYLVPGPLRRFINSLLHGPPLPVTILGLRGRPNLDCPVWFMRVPRARPWYLGGCSARTAFPRPPVPRGMMATSSQALTSASLPALRWPRSKARASIPSANEYYNDGLPTMLSDLTYSGTSELSRWVHGSRLSGSHYPPKSPCKINSRCNTRCSPRPPVLRPACPASCPHPPAATFFYCCFRRRSLRYFPWLR